MPFDEILQLSTKQRRTIRSICANLSKQFQIVLATTTLHRHIKAGELKWHTNAIKPKLTERNEVQRVNHCVGGLLDEAIAIQPRFSGFYDTVHMDEK